MILFVGLGNPGEKYKNNRHNVGFMLAEFLAKKLQEANYEIKKDWNINKYLESEITELTGKNGFWIFAEPQTYMNNSGESVKKLSKTYSVDAANIYVAHDDLDIPIGKFKIQMANGPKLHNGLESIQNHLHTMDFWRIRIGVENRGQQRIPGETYVLQNFTEEEKNILNNTFATIYERLVMHLKNFS